MPVIDMQVYRDRTIARRQINPLQLSFDLLIIQFKLAAIAIKVSLIAIDLVTENIRRLTIKGPEPK